MENFISINISYLVKKINLNQDEFGALFDIGKNVTGNYIAGKSLPKIETLQKICTYFEISLDDIVNSDLSKPTKKEVVSSNAIDANHIQLLQEQIELLKENKKQAAQIIAFHETKIEILEQDLQKCQGEKKHSTAVK